MIEHIAGEHKKVKIGDLDVTIRPITPEDKGIEAAFVRSLSMQTKYERFFEGIRELSPYMLQKLCEIDYVNTMAYVATIESDAGETEIGVCRYAPGNSPDEREIAITVADEYDHIEVATPLLNALIEHANSNKVKRIFSVELNSNRRMKALAKAFQMTAKRDPQQATQIIYTLELQA